MISLWLFASLLTTALCRRHRNFVHISGGDDECTTPHNVEGECVPLRQCEPIMSLLRGGMSHQKMTYIRRSMCKFTGVVNIRLFYLYYVLSILSPNPLFRLHPRCVLSRGASVPLLVRLGPLVLVVSVLCSVWRRRDQEAEIMSWPRLPGSRPGPEISAEAVQ